MENKKMKIILVDDTLKDVESLQKVLTNDIMQKYKGENDNIIFDDVVSIGYHEHITKDELENKYDDVNGIISSIKKEVETKNNGEEDYEVAILLDVILTKRERLSALQSNNPPKIELANLIIKEFSEKYNICLITNYENYTRYYETMLGAEWKDLYVVKSQIKREDEFMMREMIKILVEAK